MLSEDKEGSAHLGYIWASYAPVNKLVLFTYQKSRSSESMNNHLNGFVGKNQVDGYGPYEKLQQIPGMQMFSCWAHARRKFDKALESYKPEAEKHYHLFKSYTMLKSIAEIRIWIMNREEKSDRIRVKLFFKNKSYPGQSLSFKISFRHPPWLKP